MLWRSARYAYFKERRRRAAASPCSLALRYRTLHLDPYCTTGHTTHANFSSKQFKYTYRATTKHSIPHVPCVLLLSAHALSLSLPPSSNQHHHVISPSPFNVTVHGGPGSIRTVRNASVHGSLVCVFVSVSVSVSVCVCTPDKDLNLSVYVHVVAHVYL